MRIEGVLALLCLAPLLALAQEPEGFRGNDYFDCPYINFFDQDCPQRRQAGTASPQARPGQEGEERQDARPEAPAPGEGIVEPGETMRHYLELQKSLGDRHELFPEQSMAPDTPPLMHALMRAPNLDTARLYVLWHAARVERLHEVLRLIEMAGAEYQADGRVDGAAGNRSVVGGLAGR